MEPYQNNPYFPLTDLTGDEWVFVQQATADLTENQKKNFYIIYSGKRKKSQDLLIFTILGFFGFAGIQRFALGQIGMGLLYFFTFGLCWIGTIVDLVNYKTLGDEHNRKMAYESYHAAKMTS